MTAVSFPKKLIEVALPLPEINDASAYDKLPGIGPHPKGIHHWWARLPLPVARAVLFASVVDDPSAHPEKWPTEKKQDEERERLFAIIRRMMQKTLHRHPEVYAEAHAEMLKHCDGKLPAVLDPFSGGGSIPLEANRLGFEANAADLNPVAVLLNKCNLEITPRWSGQVPVNPGDRRKIAGTQNWRGTTGLAADVRYYAHNVHNAVEQKIGKYYPKIKLPAEHGGGDGNIIAWIWARTVASSDAAYQGAHVPLISTFWLSSVEGKYSWLEPVVNKAAKTYRFEVRTGTPGDMGIVKSGTKLGKKANFRCLLSGQPLSYKYVRGEAAAQRLGRVLLAIVVETKRSRMYLPATFDQTKDADAALPAWLPEELVTTPCHDVDRLPMYGMPRWGDAFTSRQLLGLTTLSDTLRSFRVQIIEDAKTAGHDLPTATAYAQAVSTFLALALDRCADFNTALCAWNPANQKVMHLFGKQAIPMNWDFAEANLLGDTVGSWSTCSDYIATCVETIQVGKTRVGRAQQADAATGAEGVSNLLVSTDPPYYDNIGYAALSDFFYVWLRRTVGDIYPELFGTMLVPKMAELTAEAGRFEGDRSRARDHFESGFKKTFSFIHDRINPAFPLTVYYAFKQDDEDTSEEDSSGDNEKIDLTTGWETLLDSLISSGFQITATWPVRAAQKWRMTSMGTNALASYIVLACRPRTTANKCNRREFLRELKQELPAALRHLQQGNIAPVDFAQAAIGPGMAIYSKYVVITDASGAVLSVRDALREINRTLTEVLTEQDDEFDNDTRWATAWYEQCGFAEGEFGQADVLARAKVTSVNGVKDAGIVAAGGGKVRLLRPGELPKDWNPAEDRRPTIWEMTHHLVRVYHVEKGGDQAAANLLKKIGSKGELARDLAYRLFSLAEKRKAPDDALGYNALVLGWPEIARLAREAAPKPAAPELNLDGI